MATPARRASLGLPGEYGRPSIDIDPASGCSAPARMAISVLLPAPFCPTSPQISPGATDRSTPSSATVAPKTLRIPRISNPGFMIEVRWSMADGRTSSLLQVRFQERFHLGRVHVRLGRDVDAGVDPLLDGLPLEVRDHRLDRLVAHVYRILD